MLIHGGIVILKDGPAQIDIRTMGEIVAELGEGLTANPNEEKIDATGKLVLPGLIDSHVHFRDPGATHKEDFYTGTRAALAGGVTTILDMPNTNPSTDTQEHLSIKQSLAAQKAIADYGFYIGATDTNIEEAAALAPQVAAMKMYLGSSTGSLLVTEFAPIYKHFSSFPLNKPLVVHAEDESALRYFNTGGVSNHNAARPPLCAQIALSRAIAVAEKTGRALHVAHVTTDVELALIRDARMRGVRITCEVTPLHLFLNENDARALGNFGKVNPPLRSEGDQKGLWESLDIVDTIATDHAPHTREEKEQEYSKAPSGIPGVETMLPLLLTAANEGSISFQDIVQKTVVNPARIFGIKNKGAIEIGKDADIVLINQNQWYEITSRNIMTKCGWTPFEGWHMKGKIEKVFLRGRLVNDQGEITTEQGSGKPVQLI